MQKQNALISGKIFLHVTGNDGFTLVELAVSMVVIGILLGLGISMMGPLMISIKVRESRENLGAAVESVNSWASGNNRLPDVTAGTTGLKNVVKTPSDAWGQDFIYLYDANLAPATATKDTICGRRSTQITLTTADPAATIANVAYVMLSKSDDSTINTTSTDGIITTSRTAAGTVNANTSDDLVRWVTLDELRTKIGCQGAQLKIVNNELPYGSKGSPYVTTLYADGGVPFASSPATYKWCVEINNRTTLPGGIVLCSTNTNPCTGTTPLIKYTQSGQYCSDQAESAWPAAFSNVYATSGTTNPSEDGSFSFTIYLRDNNSSSTASVSCSDTSASTDRDNCVSKPFVLTISPSL